MSKFIKLLEQFDPANSGNDENFWRLVDFFREKRVPIKADQNAMKISFLLDDMEIPVTVSGGVEEDDEASSMIDDISNDPNDKFQTPASQVIKKRQTLAPKIIANANQKLSEVEKSLNRPVNTMKGV